MTPHQLTRLIQDDLASNAASLSWHGRPLHECLCEPRKQRFADSFNNNEAIDLWLVFEENASPDQGYKVIYSERDGEFGLATAGVNDPVLIGIYGGFVETLNSM